MLLKSKFYALLYIIHLFCSVRLTIFCYNFHNVKSVYTELNSYGSSLKYQCFFAGEKKKKHLLELWPNKFSFLSKILMSLPYQDKRLETKEKDVFFFSFIFIFKLWPLWWHHILEIMNIWRKNHSILRPSLITKNQSARGIHNSFLSTILLKSSYRSIKWNWMEKS